LLRPLKSMWQMDVEKEVQSTKYKVQSKKKILSQSFLAIFILLIIAGCRGNKPERLGRVALVAPFEGRYREAGYNAYYAAKLAFHDYSGLDVEMIAVDDGGAVESAVDRARALVGDPLVKAVIALGYAATNEEAQAAFGNLPVVVVGYWDAEPTASNIFMLHSPAIDETVTLPDSAREITAAAQIDRPIIGGDVLGLQQFPLLNQNGEEVIVVSSGNLPDADFVTRYLESAAFTPQPGLLATLTYDATSMTLAAISNAKNGDVGSTLADMNYKGLNGDIHFENGYWVNAPIHYFEYDAAGNLSTIDRPIE
jgi:ABC-type branched-subunit amino acid transport system substrate-binding protein